VIRWLVASVHLLALAIGFGAVIVRAPSTVGSAIDVGTHA
jgi:hypothetical protein